MKSARSLNVSFGTQTKLCSLEPVPSSGTVMLCGKAFTLKLVTSSNPHMVSVRRRLHRSQPISGPILDRLRGCFLSRLFFFLLFVALTQYGSFWTCGAIFLLFFNSRLFRRQYNCISRASCNLVSSKRPTLPA